MASPAGNAKLFETLVNSIAIGPEAHDRIEVRAPFTGAAIGCLPAARDADVEGAVSLARAAQKPWAERRFAERRAFSCVFTTCF